MEMGRRMPAASLIFQLLVATVTAIFLFALRKVSIFSLPLQVPIPGLWFIPRPFNYKPLRFHLNPAALVFSQNMLRGRSSVYFKLEVCARGTHNTVFTGQQRPPKTQLLNGLSDNEKDKNSFEL